MKIESMGGPLIEFADRLRENGKAEATIHAYCYAVWEYQKLFGNFEWQSMHEYKERLVRTCKPRTVNQRICGLNTWLKYSGSDLPRLKQVKVQQISYLENVISDDEYRLFKQRLAEDGHWTYYYLVHFMASTGMRVSEVRQITVEDVKNGWKDVISKGGKSRRVFFPKLLRDSTLSWLSAEGILHGPIFRNHLGSVITPSGIRTELRAFAAEYHIPPEVVHPHSFRHLFAKSFLHSYPDISLLADLLGHTKIDTTRIYLRNTCSEQMHLIDKVVTW